MERSGYLRSFTAGTYDTKDVAERLSEMSTVSKGDTYAVLIGLGEVLGSMMELGYSVKQDGLGTFYWWAMPMDKAWTRQRKSARSSSAR